MPFCAWCPICVATKRPNHHHRRYKSPERRIPFVVADYGYARNSGEDNLICILVIKIYPFGLFWAAVGEGTSLHDENVARRIAGLFQNPGLLQIAFRSDQEATLTSMFDAACRLSWRKPLPITAEQEGAAVEALRGGSRELADFNGRAPERKNGRTYA